MTLKQKVVLPEDSGPYTSMMRPLGKPPTPRARSMASEPVESVSTFILVLLPRRMIEPSPNCLVMAESASSMFLSRTGAAVTTAEAVLAGGALDMVVLVIKFGG